MLTIKDHTELELGTENEREPTVCSSMLVPEPNSRHWLPLLLQVPGVKLPEGHEASLAEVFAS